MESATESRDDSESSVIACDTPEPPATPPEAQETLRDVPLSPIVSMKQLWFMLHRVVGILCELPALWISPDPGQTY